MANSPSLSLVREQARPKKLGRYELEECLGSEGGHETYRARVRGLAGFDRIFAVKCLRRSSGPPPSRTDPFVVAAKRLTAVADSRVARVLDTDVVDGVAIAVSEFVHGLDLERFREWAQVSGALATGDEEPALRWQKVVAYIGAEIAGALAALHALTPPLVHGGLSPRNVIATTRGGIKLLDAGLAVAAQRSGEPVSPRTLAYASPRSPGAEPTAADDIRALGVMLFEMATGELPPEGEVTESMLEPLWPAMADPLARMLAEDRATRPRSAKVAEILASQWADATDAAMATEMATLVRNFSAFVADSPSGGPPVSPEPVPTAKTPPPALLSVAPPPSPSARPSASFLTTSDERTVVNPDERYATAMFQALAVDAAPPPSPKDPAPSAAQAVSGPGLGLAKPPGAAAGNSKPSEKRPGPGMRNAAPPVTARTLMMSPAPAVPPQVVPSPPRPVPPPVRSAPAPLEVVPPPLATAPPPLAPQPRFSPPMPSTAIPSGVAPTIPALPVAPPPLPLRPTEVLPLPEPSAEAAEWGAQALAALGSQAGIPLSLGSVGPSTGMGPSPLPPPLLAEGPPLVEEAFAYAPAADPPDAWTAPQPVSQGAGMMASELLEDEQMENDHAPVFVPVEAGAWSPAQDDGEKQAEPALQATAFLSDDDEPFEEQMRMAQAMPAPEEESPRPAEPRPASQSQSAFATENLDDDSWQQPAAPSRGKKLIIMVAVAAGVGALGAAVLVGLVGKKPAEPLPVLRKPAAKKLAAPPAKKTPPAAVATATKSAGATAGPAPAAKTALAEKTVPTAKAAPEKMPQAEKVALDKVAKALPEKAPTVEPTAAKAAASTSVAASGKVAPTIAPKPTAPTKVAAPVLGGLVRVPVASRPNGAMVWINGEERGKTPCTVDLKPGSARVVLVRAGHLTNQSTLEVRDGARIDATLKPVEPPMTGDARFRAECKTHGKLPIVVDGKETGILCPFSKMRVNPGSHTIGLFVPATGTVHNKDIILFAGVRSVVFGD